MLLIPNPADELVKGKNTPNSKQGGYCTSHAIMLSRNRVQQCCDVTHRLEFTALITKASSSPAYFRIKNVPAPVVKIARHHSSTGLSPTEGIGEGLRDVIKP